MGRESEKDRKIYICESYPPKDLVSNMMKDRKMIPKIMILRMKPRDHHLREARAEGVSPRIRRFIETIVMPGMAGRDMNIAQTIALIKPCTR
jgi:hypothetical protein